MFITTTVITFSTHRWNGLLVNQFWRYKIVSMSSRQCIYFSKQLQIAILKTKSTKASLPLYLSSLIMQQAIKQRKTLWNISNRNRRQRRRTWICRICVTALSRPRYELRMFVDLLINKKREWQVPQITVDYSQTDVGRLRNWRNVAFSDFVVDKYTYRLP